MLTNDKNISELTESVIFCARDMAMTLAESAVKLSCEIISLQKQVKEKQDELQEVTRLLTAAKRFCEAVIADD